MKKILFISILLFIFVFNGCERKECLTEGVIVEKAHCPSHSTLMPVWTGKTIMLIPRAHPDRWLITVENENTKETLSISKDDWDRVQVGQTVKIPDIKNKMIWKRRN